MRIKFTSHAYHARGRHVHGREKIHTRQFVSDTPQIELRKGRKLPLDALPIDMEPRQDKRLYFQLTVAQQALRKRVDEQGVARTGLTSAQMSVLHYLAKHDGCLLKDLGRALGVKNAAVTGLVARTEKTGCIKRKASSSDGRATHLHLTAKGQRKLEEIKRVNEELGRELRAGFNESELDTISRFFQHVLAVAKKDEEAEG